MEAKPSTKSLFADRPAKRGSPVGVIIELPEMYKLIDRAGIALEVTDKFLVLPALLERREADLLKSFTASAILPTCNV